MSAAGFDGYIFDMDGTLWDAVDSYCAVWNSTIDMLGVPVDRICRNRLEKLMGKSIDVIFDELVGGKAPRDRFIGVLDDNESAMMPGLGGVLYPGVRSALEILHAGGARLFMVSNCGRDGLRNFLRYTGLEPLFTDALSFGGTGCGKTQNILAIVRRYGLEKPVYVGDTVGDCDSTHAAGLPFAWASYGFGRDVTDAEYTLKSFPDILNLN